MCTHSAPINLYSGQPVTLEKVYTTWSIIVRGTPPFLYSYLYLWFFRVGKSEYMPKIQPLIALKGQLALKNQSLYIYITNSQKIQNPFRFFWHCKKNKWGIPNGSRARPVLFQTKTLQKSTTAYPSIGQKKLNGASSRLMVHFAASIAADIAGSHENETYRRHWPKAIQIFFIYLCAVFW